MLQHAAASAEGHTEVTLRNLKAQDEATKAQREAIEVQRKAAEAETKAAEASIASAKGSGEGGSNGREKRQVHALVGTRRGNFGRRFSSLGILLVLECYASEIIDGSTGRSSDG